VTPGEPVDGSEAGNALAVLNRMLKSWSASNQMVPFRTLEPFSLPAGVGSRTIGPGAQFDTVRPDYVTDAFLRDASGFDTPFDVGMTSGQYNAIGLKTTTGRPRRLFYDPQFPNGVLYFEFTTDVSYTLFLESLKPVAQFSSLQAALNLPGEYEEAIVYLLAGRLAVEYGVSVSDELAYLIKQSEKVVRRKNAQPVAATFDISLRTSPLFNIISG
jgi:hypothetical protein